MKKITFLCCISLTNIALADAAFVERKDVKSFINDTHKKYALPKEQIKNALAQAKLQKRVIHSIKHPKEAKAWTDYRKIFITPYRVSKGIEFMSNNQKLLNKASQQYGVPPEIIAAIIGVETSYGNKQGNYRVIDSLSTLAFNFERRAPFFKKELANFLKLCDEQHINPTTVFGSYAGAIGQPQFMPSSYRAYAVDFNGNGSKDLRNSTADSIGSVANYLSVHGWKANEGVIEQVSIQNNQSKKLITSVKYAKYPLQKFSAQGIKGSNAKAATKGSLVEFKSPKTTEYWLAYPNFYVITKYNTSSQYALAVFLLAQKLKQSQLSDNDSSQKA